jgi:hypothetical protein
MNFIMLIFHKPLSKEDVNNIYLFRENWIKKMESTFGKDSISNPNSHCGSHLKEDFQFGIWANLNEKIYEHKHKFSKMFILRSNLNLKCAIKKEWKMRTLDLNKIKESISLNLKKNINYLKKGEFILIFDKVSNNKIFGEIVSLLEAKLKLKVFEIKEDCYDIFTQCIFLPVNSTEKTFENYEIFGRLYIKKIDSLISVINKFKFNLFNFFVVPKNI